MPVKPPGIKGYLGVRQANESDSETIWKWANENISTAILQNAIPRDTHEQWFKKKLESPDCFIWLLDNVNGPIGQVRYEVEGYLAHIDISIIPDFRGQGLAKHLIFQTVPLVVEKRPEVKGLVAKVRTDNYRSKSMFKSCGFAKVKEGGIEVWAIPILKSD